MNVKFQMPFVLRLACVLISLVIIGWLASWAQNIFIPLTIGFLISIMLVPFCNFMENRWYFSRGLATIVTTLLFALSIIVVFYLLLLQLIQVSDKWPMFQKQIMGLFDEIQLWISAKFGVDSKNQLEYFNSNLSKTIGVGTTILEEIFSNVTRYAVFTLFTLLYVIFILIYRKHLVRFIFYVFEKKHHPTVLKAIYSTQKMVKQYLLGLALQMILVGILTFIGLSIIGIKYAIPIAMLTAMLNIIPYVGIFSSMAMTCLIAFATSTPIDVLFVVVAYIVIHAIDGNIIMPKIVGSKVQINSLVVIIGLVLGEMIWGIMGMLLAIPLLALIKIIFSNVPDLVPWAYLLGEEKSIFVDKDVEGYFRQRRKLHLRRRKRKL